MKKRILALALAGTTAFSVFGAAISANALNTVGVVDSTHEWADNDVYVSYEPVATTIVSKAGKEATATPYYTDKLTGWKEIGKDGGLSVDDYMNMDSVKVQEKYIGLYTLPNGKYVTADKSSVTDGSDLKAALNITETHKDGDDKTYYDFNGVSYDTLAKAVDAALKDISVDYYWTKNWGTEKLTATAYEALPTKAEYIASNLVIAGYNAAAGGKDAELTVNGNSPAGWAFNADTTGEATIDFFVFDNVTASSKKVQPTIFAYDFIYNNTTDNSAAAIANAWDGTTAAANVIGTHELVAETGTGVSYKGIRFDVVNDWVDFLETLAIDNDNGYRESREDFISLYSDMYYGDPVYSVETGKLLGYDYVDLYNIDGLLNDIYDLSARYADASKGITGWNDANTSEMVYLMQQYDKYIGNYINTEPVETTEWGELMLSVLESATADDFRKTTDYTRYVNQVEELADAYENATTANMVRAAEQGMYDLLTNSTYRASATVSVDELDTTLESLYFNVGKAPAVYATGYKTVGTTNVDYKNYSYYYDFQPIVVRDTTGEVRGAAMGFVNAPKFYSLYPMADYVQTGNTNAVYTGNATTVAAGADKDYLAGSSTDEYQWFYNVYELAVAMKAGNDYQGSIDAIDEALNAAVADLAVTTTPYNSEVVAKEEMMEAYDGKIDTDYNEGYYTKYTEAYDYAENVAEGRYQQYVAREIVAIAGDALTWQGTQVTVSKNDMKTVRTAISDGKAALEAIKADANYNAAQVNALNKALNQAQALVDLYDGIEDATVNHADTHLVGDKDQIVKSDLTAAIEAIDAAINYSEVIVGWHEFDEGWKYGYEKEDGTLAYVESGWYKVGASWFYFKNSVALENEWIQENGKWYYLNSNCAAAYGWAKIDGKWYYFNGDNSMRTGWVKTEGNWYYLNAGGAMVTGWAQIDGKWYYFNKNENAIGQMLYSTTTPDGYKLGADGAWIK